MFGDALTGDRRGSGAEHILYSERPVGCFLESWITLRVLVDQPGLESRVWTRNSCVGGGKRFANPSLKTQAIDKRFESPLVRDRLNSFPE